MSRRTWVARDLGIPIVLTPYLIDGEVFMFYPAVSRAVVPGTTILLGTRPRTELELARHRGLWIAQQGLIDWLAYIGERPIPKHQRTHQDVLKALHAHT